MKTNPILEEVWRIKDELAREAGYDLHRFCENTRKWAAEHPHSGPIVKNAEELRQLAAELERKHAEASAPALKEKPPRQDGCNPRIAGPPCCGGEPWKRWIPPTSPQAGRGLG